MGFFSKKIFTGNKKDTHKMIDAKIHVMQHDLDEIAKNGYVEIESPHKEISAQKKPTPAMSPENNPVPSGSPFSQSPYSSPDDISTSSLETPRTPAETSQQETLPSKDIFPPKEVKGQTTPLTRPSTPLQAAPTSIPHEAMHLNIGGQFPTDTRPTEPASQKPILTEIPKSPATQQESLRTGTWPVESSTKAASSKKHNQKETALEKISLQETPTDKKIVADDIILKERWGWKQLLLMFVVFGVIGGGIFYFWKTRFSREEMSPSIVTHPNIPDVSGNKEDSNLQTEPTASLPFSTTNTNPFLVDVETETVSTLREQLMKNAEAMKQANMTGPVSFSVVDKTNTPIAFFIFASIFNLGLSGDLLNSLDNNFTLSLFLDNGEPRAILSITVKNSADAQKYLSLSEKTLPLSLKNVLLVDTPPSVPAATFSTTPYKSTTIRYFNFSTETPLSFDYTFIDNTLIIGTSKNAERASIDAILDSKK